MPHPVTSARRAGRPARAAACLLVLAALAPLAAPRASAAPVAAAIATPRPRTGLERIERQVQEFQLANGVRFLLVERHDAPVFAFQTVVAAGSAADVTGATGLAHMLEHMAFKGTPWVGTRDFDAERPLMEAEDRAFEALRAERRRGALADSARLDSLARAFTDAREAARAPVVGDEFTRMLEQAGARGVNAFTSSDVTGYQYALPSNRLGLWARLEGGRLTHPVFREFHQEREVVIEERRMSTESSPFGRLLDEFVHLAYVAHPYGVGTIGHASDLASFTRADCEAFFRRHYVGPAIVIAVVGDVTRAELQALAERHFADIPAGPAPPAIDTVEPEQRAERRAVIEDPAQPILAMGWHVPANADPRGAAYRALADLLGGGDHARLQKALVKERPLSAYFSVATGIPGDRDPGMFGILGVPVPGVTADSLERAVEEVLADVRAAHPFTEAEVAGYRVRVRAQKLAAVEDAGGLALELALAQTLHGDWRQAFREQERVQALTPAALDRALRESLTRANRTVVSIAAPAAAPAEGGN